MTNRFTLQPLEPSQWEEVSLMIGEGTNHWYESHAMGPIFSSPELACVFCDVYERLDPGCCIVAIDTEQNRIAGSCFYHPRPTHVSLGIMNVHQAYFGHGLAKRLLNFVIDFATTSQRPVRLVSSAMNLDSFSLYTKAGFVPHTAFQDMYLEVPDSGLQFANSSTMNVREGRLADVPAMVELEERQTGISRAKDFEFFLNNESGIWHTSVVELDDELRGFLVSVNHPGSNMLGPGVFTDDESALLLIQEELNQHRGRRPVFLVPVNRPALVSELYKWGAKNCEIHFAQCLGEFKPIEGVVMPTFMPESG